MTILAPASENEMRLILDWALNREQVSGIREQSSGPVIIRYPKTYIPQEISAFSQPIETGRGVWIKKCENAQICLCFTGSLYHEVQEAHTILKEQGVETDLYNLRFLKPVDEENLVNLLNSYKLTVFIEEGLKEGGFCEYAVSIAMLYKCTSDIKILAVSGNFQEKNKALGSRKELLSINNLNGKGISNAVMSNK